MIYHKYIPSIPGAIWGWSYWENGVLWFMHASYTSPEDAQDSMESFMVHKWTE